MLHQVIHLYWLQSSAFSQVAWAHLKIRLQLQLWLLDTFVMVCNILIRTFCLFTNCFQTNTAPPPTSLQIPRGGWCLGLEIQLLWFKCHWFLIGEMNGLLVHVTTKNLSRRWCYFIMDKLLFATCNALSFLSSDSSDLINIDCSWLCHEDTLKLKFNLINRSVWVEIFQP